jgi:hypothetical protein
MDEDSELKGALGWQYRPKRTETRLGEEASSYLKQRNRTLMKNAIVVDLWDEIFPPSLKPFCSLETRVGNTLYIQAQPGPYMHQAQMLTDELLDRMNQLAPHCGIQKIRVVPKKRNRE